MAKLTKQVFRTRALRAARTRRTRAQELALKRSRAAKKAWKTRRSALYIELF